MNHLTPYLQCVRSKPDVEVIYAWPLIVGMFAAARTIPNPLIALEAFIAISAIAYAVYIYNDLHDYKEDLESTKLGDRYYLTHRPLLNGTVSRQTAKNFILATSCIGIVTSLLINLTFLFLILIYLGLGIIYSTPPIRLKKRFMFKQLVVAIGAGISTLAGGAAVGIISNPVIYAAALFFTLDFGINPIVDLRDLHADKSAGLKTLPLVLGPKRTVLLALLTVLSTTLASVISYAWIGFNIIFPIMAGCAGLVLSLFISRVFYFWNKPDYIENTFIKKTLPIYLLLQTAVIVGVVF